MQIQDDKSFSFLDKRRQIIIKTQKSRRQQIFNRTRQIYQITTNIQQQKHQTIKSNNDESIQRKQKKKSHSIHKNYNWDYYKHFQYPQWMISLPSNFLQCYITFRPIEQRILISIKKSKIRIISRYGINLLTIHLSKQIYHGTLLQGYYFPDKKQIIVSDLLIWKQNPMSSSQFQFRISWLISNFNQQNIINNIVSINNNVISKNYTNQSELFKFKLMKYFNVNSSNLQQLYNNVNHYCQYKADSILFYHKDSFYTHGVNPDVLLWKDHKVSQFISFSSSKIQNIQMQSQQHQQNQILQLQDEQQSSSVIFFNKQFDHLNIHSSSSSENINNNLYFYAQCLQNGILCTYDKVPLIDIFNYGIKNNLKKINKKFIVKFMFTDIKQNINNKFKQNYYHYQQDQQIHQQQIKQFPFNFINFKIIGKYQIGKRIPDSISKIIFKFNLSKNQQIKYEQIMNKIKDQEDIKNSSLNQMQMG